MSVYQMADTHAHHSLTLEHGAFIANRIVDAIVAALLPCTSSGLSITQLCHRPAGDFAGDFHWYPR
jgi:hypothetical protein